MSSLTDNKQRSQMDNHLTSIFNSLGLSGSEASSYVSMVELGVGSASEIAKLAGVPRSTAYGLIESLVAKGLVSKETSDSKIFFRAIDPKEAIKRLVDLEKESLKQKENSAKEIIEYLTPFFGRAHHLPPKINTFEGKRAIENMLYTYQPKWTESYINIGEDTMWGFQDHTFVDEYKDWHNQSWKRPVRIEKICLFSTKEGLKQQKKEKIANREIRRMPGNQDFNSSIWVHGEYTIIATTRREPHFALLINDSVISNNFRMVFKTLWELTEK